ncbi:MAG: acyl-CoA dehydrogenase family protein [Myxococcales bacterium]|nr:acyl-CoA dehydrogenase family protein [Myxococcales bacterium]
MSVLPHVPTDEVAGPLCAEVTRFAARSIDARAIDRAGAIPAGVLGGLAELGLFGLTLPAAHGGAGCGLLTACQVVAELARFDRSVAVTLGLHLGLGTRGLVAFGTSEQHERYLPSLAAGERLAAFATTEPQAGSDLSNLATRALEAADGSLVVNGRKVFVTNGGLAGLYTLAVATPGLGGRERGQSLVLVERGDAGLTVEAEECKLGLKGSSTTGLVLEDVRLPSSRLLGEPGWAAKGLAHILSWGRTLMSAGCVGTARAALDKVHGQVAHRRQFGKPLAALEVVREQVALLEALTFGMAALVDEVARADDEALLGRSLAAKVYSSESAWRVVDGAIQLHGGLGFIEDTGLAVMLRDVRVTRIFEGANDVLLSHLGAGELTRTKERAPLTGAVGLPLAGLATKADALAAQVEARRQELLARYKVGVFRQPRWMHQLGGACCWREAVDAAVRRAAVSARPEDVARASLLTLRASAEVSRLLEEPAPRDLVEVALSDTLPFPEVRP